MTTLPAEPADDLPESADVPGRFARTLVVAFAVLLAVLGAGALVASRVPTPAVKARLDRMSPDGSAGGFDDARIAAVLTRAALAGGAMLLVGVGGLAARRPVARFVGALPADARAMAGDLGHAVRRDAIGWATVAVVTAAGLGLRVAFLDRPASPDEVTTLMSFAARPLPYAVGMYPSPNNHLLYTLMVWVTTRLFGEGLAAIRLPALVIGTAVVPAAYLLAHSLSRGLSRGSRTAAGVAAGSLAAVAPYLVHYSVNGRGYGAVALAFAASVPLGLYLVATANRAAGVLLAAAWALGFFAIPTMLYPFGVAWLFLAATASVEGRRSAWGVLVVVAFLAGGMTLALYGPAFVVSGPGALAGNKFVSAVPFGQFVEGTRWRFGLFLGATHAAMPWPVVVLVAFGAAAALLVPVISAEPRVGRWRPAVFVGVGLAWCLTLLLSQRAVPFARVWTFLIPAYFALAAVGWAAVVGRAYVAWKGRPVERWGGLAVGAGLALLTAVPVGVVSTAGDWPARVGEEGPAIPDVADFVAFAKSVSASGNRILTVQPARPVLQYAIRRARVRQSLLGREPGGTPYNYVYNQLTPEQLNEKLQYEGLPALEPARLTVAAQFGDSAVYRIDPPLPSGKSLMFQD